MNTGHSTSIYMSKPLAEWLAWQAQIRDVSVSVLMRKLLLKAQSEMERGDEPPAGWPPLGEIAHRQRVPGPQHRAKGRFA